MFAANADLLAQHGLVYPKLTRFTGHHGLALNWAGMPKMYQLPKGTIGTLTEIAAQHADSDDTVFLSSEEFSRRSCIQDIGRMREALAGFDQIEVVCVLRTQWQFLQSVYLEISKNKLAPRPPTLIKPVMESGLFQELWVDYNGILDALEPHFAPEEITLLEFDTLRRADGGVIGGMLRHLGIDVPPDALTLVNEGQSNVSPLSLASWSANIIAEPHVAPSWLIDKTTEALLLEFGQNIKPCLFTREEFQTLKDHFDACNARLSLRRATVQPDFSIPPANRHGLKPFRDDLSSAFWLRAARRITLDLL